MTESNGSKTKSDWRDGAYAKSVAKAPERDYPFDTSDGEIVDPLYSPEDRDDWEYAAQLGFPGEFPYTRGVQPTMYRGRLWTMRQYAGFGDAEESNARYRYLLQQGQTGLSVAFDLPTQIGYDSDHPMAMGEVGKVGVAIASLADMELLMKEIPLETATTSMTINATGSILLAFYVAVAKKQGADLTKVGGTTQNDILKEYIARGTYIFPPGGSMRLITDVFGWSKDNLPSWNTISISGYHMREAGCTAIQEVAFTFANAIAYVEAALKAGLEFDEFAPRLSFFYACFTNLVEEVAKFRAARRMWAHLCRAALRRQRPALEDAPLPHADRRFDAHRAAAGEQHRPHGDPGPRGCAGRHAVAPHELHGRSARAAHREGRADRPAHAAGHRLREWRRGRHRPARRLLLRRRS